jgi:hypothetical protein
MPISYSAITASGTDIFGSQASLTSSTPSEGDIAYSEETRKLYLYNGDLWYAIAIINQSPAAITGNNAEYNLELDGTPTIVNLISSDPEGLPITWSYEVTGDSAVATILQDSSQFTFTPSTTPSDQGVMTVTFSVTDGDNVESTQSIFSLTFPVITALPTTTSETLINGYNNLGLGSRMFFEEGSVMVDAKRGTYGGFNVYDLTTPYNETTGTLRHTIDFTQYNTYSGVFYTNAAKGGDPYVYWSGVTGASGTRTNAIYNYNTNTVISTVNINTYGTFRSLGFRGNYLYTLQNNTVSRYVCNTPGSLSDVTLDISGSTEISMTDVYCWIWQDDGLRCWTSNIYGTIREYDLTTAWDPRTATAGTTYTTVYHNFPVNIHLQDNGEIMWQVNGNQYTNQTNKVYKINMVVEP